MKSKSGIEVIIWAVAIAILVTLVGSLLTSCDHSVSSSGTERGANSVRAELHSIDVQTGPDGKTAEQRNIEEAIRRDNLPGAIKHVYLLSAYSNKVLVYDTARGKVSSASKRLKPKTVSAGAFGYGQSSYEYYGIPVTIDGKKYFTEEVRGDDGTYGDSVDAYIWFSVTSNAYRRVAMNGACILIVSDEPLPLNQDVGIDMTLTAAFGPPERN